MQTHIRTFTAPTVEDALAQIRREMGFDAVVVETKQVERRGLMPWSASRHEFEVKAARIPAQRRTRADGQTAETFTLPAIATAIETQETPRSNVPSTINVSPSVGSLAAVPTANAMIDAGQPSAPTPIALERSVANPSVIEQRLEALQQMIAELGQRTRPRGMVEIPPSLFAHYLSLIEADVEEEIARELIAKLQQHATSEQLTETVATTSLLAALIEREIRCTAPLTPQRGCRQVAMLVGPTGVGKTTSIAKLAGRFALTDGLKVGLITVDTYRVAAVDQLRTYAEIIDLPLEVVANPEELHAALELFAEFDLVLIDTAGRSPHDERRLEELKQLVAAANPDHVFLVLSLASGAKSLRSAAERFSAARPTSLVLTKLDEATGCGTVLSASRDIALPVTYLTAGQEVPRDIEPANPCRLARLILGRDRLTADTLALSPRPSLAGRG